MKTKWLSLILSTILLAACSGITERAQISTPPPRPADIAPRQVSKQSETTEEFRKVLLAYTWTWERRGVYGGLLKFNSDGTAKHQCFVAKFEIKSPREVLLRLGDRAAVLKFTYDASGYIGTDFDGSRFISGRRTEVPNS